MVDRTDTEGRFPVKIATEAFLIQTPNNISEKMIKKIAREVEEWAGTLLLVVFALLVIVIFFPVAFFMQKNDIRRTTNRKA